MRSSHQFVCARYGLKSIDSFFLTTIIPKIILHLSYCGFLGNTITRDGASENQSTFKRLANNLAESGHYPANLLNSSNFDFKIAFSYPKF